MVAPGKGILAADESTGTIKKRFDSIKAEKHRRQPPRLREMMFRCIRGHEEPHLRRDLYDETLRQKAKTARRWPR